jgi:hypothetical protein
VPSADELFRPTVVPSPESNEPDEPDRSSGMEAPARERRSASGRVRHDEKMTVYVTADELLDLEHARLTLRRTGLTVDRGRLVRTAIAIALADLEENGDDSVIVRRLMQA